MSYTISWREDGIYRKFSEVVQPEEILQSNFSLHEDPRFLEVDYIINDFTTIEGVRLNPDHAQIFASTDDIISDNREKKMKVAIAAQPDYQSLAEVYRQSLNTRMLICEIFNTVDDAEKWVSE